MNMNIDASVVIVTYNRPEDCLDTVRSVAQQTVKPLEIIVIDDASSTPLSLSGDLQSVKLVRSQRELGLGRARSLGSRLAKGSLIAFLDDDAVASRSWLKEVLRAFEGGADIVGGLSEPLYLSLAPWWWDDHVLGFFVGVRNDYLPKNPLVRIFGCNFATKKEVLEDLGYFKPSLGRRGGKQFGGEDVLFLLRASKRGHKLVFNEKAVVYHKVHPRRLTVRYLIRRAWYSGASWKSMFGTDPRKLIDYASSMRDEKRATGKLSAKFMLVALRFIQMLGYLLG